MAGGLEQEFIGSRRSGAGVSVGSGGIHRLDVQDVRRPSTLPSCAEVPCAAREAAVLMQEKSAFRANPRSADQVQDAFQVVGLGE
jgi:hypothetical protein